LIVQIFSFDVLFKYIMLNLNEVYCYLTIYHYVGGLISFPVFYQLIPRRNYPSTSQNGVKFPAFIRKVPGVMIFFEGLYEGRISRNHKVRMSG